MARAMCVSRHAPIPQRLDIIPDAIGALSVLLHLFLEVRDTGAALVEGLCDLRLELVDDNEVGEELQHVLNLQQLGLLHECNRPGDTTDRHGHRHRGGPG